MATYIGLAVALSAILISLLQVRRIRTQQKELDQKIQELRDLQR